MMNKRHSEKPPHGEQPTTWSHVYVNPPFGKTHATAWWTLREMLAKDQAEDK